VRGLPCAAMLGVFERTAGLKVGRDAGRAECVTADFSLEACVGRSPSDHAVHVDAVHRHPLLQSVTQTGYVRQAGGYFAKSLPPLEFEYTQPTIDETVQEIDAESPKLALWPRRLALPVGGFGFNAWASQTRQIGDDGFPPISAVRGNCREGQFRVILRPRQPLVARPELGSIRTICSPRSSIFYEFTTKHSREGRPCWLDDIPASDGAVHARRG
jgi:hypothetical protein